MESYWNKNLKNEYSKIENDMKTKICIVGGGLTGLTLGYYLSKNHDVLILEKDTICSSSSGKNTGKVTSQHGLFYDYLLNSNGEDFAKKYLIANQKAIDNIEEIVNSNKIDCDFKRESSYIFTNKEEDVIKIKNEKKAIDKIMLGKAELKENISIPIESKLAIEFKNQAKINPVKYAEGLANIIVKNGGKIYEKSTVYDIEKGINNFTLKVNDYEITADIVILATRYPILKIPGYYFLKMYQSTSYAVVADVKTELFEGMYINSEKPVLSFRTIEEQGKRLLLAIGYDYKTGDEQLENGYSNLEKVIKKMYPNAEILYKWSAEDCITLDKIPYIGEYSNLINNMYIATGYNKWGLTTSNIAANIITDKINGKENEFEEIFKSTRLEPIKNRDEMKNMITEVKDAIILSKFSIPKQTIDSIKNGEGKIVKVNNQKVGVYKSEDGEIYKVKPVCTHLGCELYFNNYDKTWECPCHGSKFTYEGKQLEVPAIKNLEKR